MRGHIIKGEYAVFRCARAEMWQPVCVPAARYHMNILSDTGGAFVSGIDEINACKWLFLEEIGEPVDNELRLKIIEAQPGGAPGPLDHAGDEFLQELLRTASSIEPSPGCKIFELHWPSYIAYSVRDESYCSFDEYEQFDGGLFKRYTRSRYLDFVASATFADASYPGPFVHYGIFCQNHVIDVVSMESPIVAMSVRS